VRAKAGIYSLTNFELLNLGKQPRKNEVLKTFDIHLLRVKPAGCNNYFKEIGVMEHRSNGQAGFNFP
jgi:hypothetical protein